MDAIPPATEPPAGPAGQGVVGEGARSPAQILAMNEALLLGSIRQHELTEEAERLNAQLRAEIAAHEKTARELTENARLLDLTQDAIIVRDSQYKVTLWNQGAERTYGWTQAEAMGHDLHTLLQTEFPKPREEIIAQLHREGQFDGEVVQAARDGRRVTSFCRWVLDRDSNSILTTHTDITQRKHAELAAVQLAAIVASSDDAIIGKTLDGVITSWNRGAEKLFGHTAAEALGRSCLELLVPLDTRAEQEHILRAIARGERVAPRETVGLRKGGEPVHVSLSFSPVTDATGAVVAASSISRDITARKQAEQALQAAEAKYRSIFEHSNDGIFQNTPDGRFLSANPALARMLGFASPEELIRERTDLEKQGYVEPALRGKFQCLLEERGFVNGFECEVQRKDGSRIWVSENTRLVRDAAGNVIYYEGSVQDITERKRAEESLRESEARYGRIAANVPGMVYQFVLHADGSYGFSFVSEGCRDIFGLEPVQIQGDVGRFLNILFPADRPEFGRRLAESARTLEPWVWQGSFVRPDTGETRCVQAASRPDRQANGDVVWDGVLMDITERERTEEHRRAKEEAERANLAKSEFLSRMSHELRTPLNAILGFGQLLEMDTLSEPQGESVRHILTAGRHLLKLVNEVLNLARVESGHMELSLEAVSVAELVDETLTLVRPLALERAVGLDLGPLLHGAPPAHGPHVSADSQRLKQVLLNLLGNAIKYNVVGGRVSLDYALAGERLRLRVTDTGPGIPAEKRARLFTPFDRLGAEHGSVEGTGVGLALSRRLMEAMGGSLGLEENAALAPATPNRPNPGATFWLDLPLAPSPVSAPATADVGGAVGPARAEPLPIHRTVLLIEDNLSNLVLVARLMEAHPGVRLLTAMQGTLGLDLARQHRPDLILLDLHLPDLSGEEVLASLHTGENTRGIPVVIVSADATERQVKRLTRAGAHAYLTKPLEVRKFLGVMREVLLAGSASDNAPGAI